MDVSRALAADQPRLDLPLPKPGAEAPSAAEPEAELPAGGAPESTLVVQEPLPEPVADPAGGAVPGRAELDPYGMFLIRLHEITAAAPLASSEIARRLALKKTQANAWLKSGVGEGKIKKTSKPVRYQSTPGGRRQGSLFGDDG